MQETEIRKLGSHREVFSNVESLKDIEPLDVVLMAQELQTCIETPDGKACGGKLVLSNDELQEWVCNKCGRVWFSELEESKTIPFEEEGARSGHFEGHYQPVNHSDYGKGLGTVVDTQLKAAVVAGSDGPGPLDYFRAKNLRIKLDEPLVIDFLGLMNEFCKKHDLDSKHDVVQIRFRDQLGLNLRYMAEYFLKYKFLKHDRWIVVASLFSSLLEDLYPDRWQQLRGKSPELSLSDVIVDYFTLILESLNVPLLPELPQLAP